MVSEHITKLLRDNGIADPIESIKFIDKNLRSGAVSENECVVVKFHTNRERLHLFMKICRKGSKTDEYETHLSPFKREILFYGEILPLLEQFYEKRTKDRQSKSSKREQNSIPKDVNERQDNVEPYIHNAFSSLFPKYYGTFTVDGSIYIIIERISESKYVLKKDKNIPDQNYIQYCLRHLAYYHAVSYCMQKIDGIKFDEGFPLLENRLVHPDDRDQCLAPLFTKPLVAAIRMIRVLFKEAKTGNPIVSKTDIPWNSLSDEIIARMENTIDKFLDVLYHTTISHGKSGVLCHGDFHMANMALNKDLKSYPIFLDFQLVSYGSALLDIIRFLYLSGPSIIRVGHLENSLNVYCEAFSTQCHELGLKKELNIFTLDFMMAEYKRLSPFGIFFGIIFRMFTALGDKLDSISSVPNEKIVELCENSDLLWWGLGASVDIILEAETHGYIDVIEDIMNQLCEK